MTRVCEEVLFLFEDQMTKAIVTYINEAHYKQQNVYIKY